MLTVQLHHTGKYRTKLDVKLDVQGRLYRKDLRSMSKGLVRTQIATDASRAAPGAVTAKEASSPIHEVPVRFISRAAPTETEADADEATAWPTITQSRA